MTKIIYWLYLNLVRKWSSPLLYRIVNSFTGELPDRWDTVKHFNKVEFEKVISQYPYKWDYKKGIIDFSPQDPDYFFADKEWFRDCDDTSRMWYWWAEFHKYPVWEVCLFSGFEKAHFVTIFKEGEKYQLCNYRLRGQYDNLEEAIKSVDGYKDYLIYKKSGDK